MTYKLKCLGCGAEEERWNNIKNVRCFDCKRTHHKEWLKKYKESMGYVGE